MKTKPSTTILPKLKLMARDETLRGKYAESAMNGLLSNHLIIDTVNWDWIVTESFIIADKMIEEEFNK